MRDAFPCAIVCPAPRALPLPPEVDPLSDTFSLAHAAEDARLRAQAALQHAENAADEAALVVLPEDIHGIRHFWRQLEAPRVFQHIAEPVPGPTTRTAAKIARRHRAYLVVALYENDAATIYNTMVLIGPRGKLLARYRKVHVAPGEHWIATAGSRFVVTKTHLGRIGLACGEDYLFPETPCVLARLGAEIVVVASKRPISDGTLGLRSSEHGFVTVFAQAGGSAFFDQRGRMLAQSAGMRDFVLAAELRNEAPWPADRDELEALLTGVAERRPRLSAFRRPEAYEALVAKEWPEAPLSRREIDAGRWKAFQALAEKWAGGPALIPEWEL